MNTSGVSASGLARTIMNAQMINNAAQTAMGIVAGQNRSAVSSNVMGLVNQAATDMFRVAVDEKYGLEGFGGSSSNSSSYSYSSSSSSSSSNGNSSSTSINIQV